MTKNIIDQTAHFALSLIVLAPIAIWPGLISFTLAGLSLGLVREASQHGRLLLSGGSLLDILFWTLGGAAVGVLAVVTTP